MFDRAALDPKPCLFCDLFGAACYLGVGKVRGSTLSITSPAEPKPEPIQNIMVQAGSVEFRAQNILDIVVSVSFSTFFSI